MQVWLSCLAPVENSTWRSFAMYQYIHILARAWLCMESYWPINPPQRLCLIFGSDGLPGGWKGRMHVTLWMSNQALSFQSIGSWSAIPYFLWTVPVPRYILLCRCAFLISHARYKTHSLGLWYIGALFSPLAFYHAHLLPLQSPGKHSLLYRLCISLYVSSASVHCWI